MINKILDITSDVFVVGNEFFHDESPKKKPLIDFNGFILRETIGQFGTKNAKKSLFLFILVLHDESTGSFGFYLFFLNNNLGFFR